MAGQFGMDSPARRLRGAGLRRLARLAQAIFLGLAILAAYPAGSSAQMGEGMGPASGSELNGAAPMATPNPDGNMMPAPVPNLHIMQPVHASMMVSPPYGLAPLRVGFFVLANDPEGIGFLTYSWNFGDGTVSALPPEMYIFHTYSQPGNYVCTLTMKTVDGRSSTLIQGVLVKPPA